MEWLESPKLQGIAALVTIAQIALLAVQALQRDGGTPRQASAIAAAVPPRPARRITTALAGSLLALVLAWLLYSLPWAGMALALGMPAIMVVTTPNPQRGWASRDFHPGCVAPQPIYSARR